MDQLLHVPQDQEIDFLYSLIRKDPDLLHTIDGKQFVDTPLHLAAAEGRTQLALEIQRLMPSLGRKLNPDGFSPVDLALRRGHKETVRAIIRLSPDLVSVQGREGFTPLHYAAEIDDVDVLAEFLLIYPDSIDELTIRGESAVHVAVKNGNLEAFKVLLGWLKRIGRTQVLRWRDFNGNTVLHLAAYTNQPEVMELLIKMGIINTMNSKGLTALDMVLELPPEVNGRALKMLQRKRAKRGSSIIIDHPKFSKVANYLSSPVKSFELIIKFDAFVYTLSGNMQNAILVVTALIATAIYQTVLSPPGGMINDSTPTPVILNMNGTSNTITSLTSLFTNTTLDGGNGSVNMEPHMYVVFACCNVLALAVSVGMICLVLPARLYNIFLYVSLLFLMIGYTVAINDTLPPGTVFYIDSFILISYLSISLIVLVKMYLLRLWDMHSHVRVPRRLIGSYNLYNIHELMTLLFHNIYSPRVNP